MKCLNCDGYYSDSVMPLHLERCESIEEVTHEGAAHDDVPPIEEMDLPGLREYAALNNIDLNGATKKSAILAVILEARNHDSR